MKGGVGGQEAEKVGAAPEGLAAAGGGNEFLDGAEVDGEEMIAHGNS